MLVLGILWAQGKSRDQLCTRVDVVIVNVDSTTFVTPQGVKEELNRMGLRTQGELMSKINSSEIERKLAMSEYLENVEVYKSRDGQLLIKARQLVPVLRVFQGDSSYYINAAGKTMAATANYHADVPVVKGRFSKQYPATRLIPLIKYVEGDSLLHALVDMYMVADSNNVFIVPNISGHVVNLGTVDNFEAKLAKLKLFYTKVMPAKGWQTYDTISLKWNHQVVATRRVKAQKVDLGFSWEDDEPLPDINNLDGGVTTTPQQNKPAEATQQQGKPAEQPAEKKAATKPAAKPAEKKPAEKKAPPKQAEAKPKQANNTTQQTKTTPPTKKK